MDQTFSSHLTADLTFTRQAVSTCPDSVGLTQPGLSCLSAPLISARQEWEGSLWGGCWGRGVRKNKELLASDCNSHQHPEFHPFHPPKQHFVVLQYTFAFLFQRDHTKDIV